MVCFGILGAVKIATRFCNAVSKIEGARVVAVASRSSERSGKFAKNNNISKYYGSYEEMLEDLEINAVYIATTH